MNDPTALQILVDIRYATVATVNEDGMPWNTPVFCAYDGKRSIYWSSHPESVHSQNIGRTRDVFIVIYNSKAGEGEGIGFYTTARAEVVVDEAEMRVAVELLGQRRERPFEHIEKFTGTGPQRIYRATFTHSWINDADQDADGDFIRDYRVAVE